MVMENLPQNNTSLVPYLPGLTLEQIEQMFRDRTIIDGWMIWSITVEYIPEYYLKKIQLFHLATGATAIGVKHDTGYSFDVQPPSTTNPRF